MAPNFFHSDAHPGNEVRASGCVCYDILRVMSILYHPGNMVVASGMFVIIYSSLSLSFPPVVFVFPWPVNFLVADHYKSFRKRVTYLTGVFGHHLPGKFAHKEHSLE